MLNMCKTFLLEEVKEKKDMTDTNDERMRSNQQLFCYSLQNDKSNKHKWDKHKSIKPSFPT